MNDDFDLLSQLDDNINVKQVGIVEFAQSAKFCNKKLYPKQKLFLKLLFLEELDDLEEQMLDGWIGSKEVGLSPQIRERTEWLKARGYPHFREAILVGGRRSSKGFLTGMAMAYKLYNALQLQDPNQHYGVDAEKEIYFACVAASEKQAKEMQYADFANTVNSCAAMQKFIYKVQELEFSVHTEADKRRLAQWQKSGRRVQRDISKLRGRALPANSRTMRGYTTLAIVFDEFAHFMQGDSDQSDDEVYEAATPALAQFGRDAMIFLNSSPYSKVGKFHEKFDESMTLEDDTPVNHSMFGIQFPSWAMFDEWWRDPTYTGAKKCITVSPDWDLERKDEKGNFFYTDADRQSILIERDNERKNPEKFKVERRARFSEVIDSYLLPEMVDRMFAGRPLMHSKGYQPMKTNWNDSSYLYRYKAHLDPSSTTAGFGFALAHTEEMELPGGGVEQHVVFDIVKRWRPEEFPEGVIDWETVLPWVMDIIDLFRPFEVTMDQFNSAAPIQWLKRELRNKGIGETRVYEKTATSTFNWNRSEIFKTALYQGVIHAPHDTEDARMSALELKYLQEVHTGRIPRVDKQDAGPVQTKDMADAIMDCVESLIGNVISNNVRTDLGEAPRIGAPKGYNIGGPDRGGHGKSPLSEFYGRRTGEQAAGPGARRSRNGAGGSPARRAFGGRPIP